MAVARWTISSLLGVTAGFLERKGSSSPRLDAELLLAHTLGLERIQLYAQHDRPVTMPELDAYRELVTRRAAHEPVAYLLGRASFRYLELEVDPHVLIPRPETEELVGAVLDWLKERPLLELSRAAVPGGGDGEAAVVDVGTGSGAIALSLAGEAGVAVLAIDSSTESLAVAARNRDVLGLGAYVSLESADLLSGREDGRFRVVVSNPPYVSPGGPGCTGAGRARVRAACRPRRWGGRARLLSQAGSAGGAGSGPGRGALSGVG